MNTSLTTQSFDMYGEDKFERLLGETCFEAAEELGAIDLELSGDESGSDEHDSVCVGATPAGRNIWVDESTRTRTYIASAFKLIGEGYSVSGYIKPIEVASITQLLMAGEVYDATDRTSHTNALVKAVRAKMEGR